MTENLKERPPVKSSLISLVKPVTESLPKKKISVKKSIPPPTRKLDLVKTIFKIYSNSKTNKTETVSNDESRVIFEKINTRLGRTFEKDLIEDFFKNLDKNADGRINMNEFSISYSNLVEQMKLRRSKNPMNKELIKTIFEMYSNMKSSKTRTLLLDEARVVFEVVNNRLGKKFDKNLVEDFFKNLKINGDGETDLNEFQISYSNLIEKSTMRNKNPINK